MTVRTSHRRASGAIRRLPSGRWQARYTGPDGAMRTIGTFVVKAEADQALAHEISTMARGGWHDPRLGEQPLGKWFRGWIAARTDIAESTRALVRAGAGHLDRRAHPRGRDRRAAESHPPGDPDTGIADARRGAGVEQRGDGRVDAAGDRAVAAQRQARHSRQRGDPGLGGGFGCAAGSDRPDPPRGPGTVGSPRPTVYRCPSTRCDANAGQTAATQAYRLLHAGMAQAVADELISANPCAIKGAGQRDARDRVDRRTVSLEEMWLLADATARLAPRRRRGRLACAGERTAHRRAGRCRPRGSPTPGTALGMVPGARANRPGLVQRTENPGRQADRGATHRRSRAARAHDTVHSPGPRFVAVRHAERNEHGVGVWLVLIMRWTPPSAISRRRPSRAPDSDIPEARAELLQPNNRLSDS
jgi:hypothetical protein